MSETKRTLLPPTATGLAKALDLLEERLLALPTGAITKDPARVDAALLDHLAWETSVDVWDPDWPEDVRRRVLADAPGWHRIKGTPQGIHLALAAIGARAVIDEWWQDGVDLPRGVARVTAYADRRLYDDAAFILERGTVRTVQSIVRAAMPVSRPVRVRMGVEGGAAQASGGRTLAHHRNTNRLAPQMTAAGLGVSGQAGASALRHRLGHQITISCACAGWGQAVQGAVVRVRHRVRQSETTP